MQRSNALAAVAGPLVLLCLATGCGEDKRRPIGAACDDDAACDSGLCGDGQCLEPSADSDGDSLSNGLEVRLGSSPLDADTDDDGIVDGGELNSSDLTNVDADGDGLANIIESVTRDPDADCIPDQYDAQNEIANSDLSPMIDVVCSFRGVCAGARAELGVECPAGTAVCIYAGVTGYSDPEASCDGLDQNCDGVADDGFPDRDSDTIADCLDTDWDNDTVIDSADNCPTAENLDQVDADADGIGDACTEMYRLAFTAQPTETTSGVVFASALTVGLEPVDSAANPPPMPTFRGRVTVTLETANGAALGGTTAVDAVGGVATFADLVVTGAGTGLVLQATSGALGAARSEAFDVLPSGPGRIAIGELAATTEAGQVQTFEVVVYDGSDRVRADFSGTVTFASSDGRAELPAATAFSALDAGRKQFSVTFVSAGNHTLNATSGDLAAGAEVAVHHAPAATLRVTPSFGTVTSGTALDATVLVQDAFANTALDYRGTVTLSVADPGATMPASHTFVAADGGAFAFTGLVLAATGTHTLRAEDAGGVRGEATVAVTPGSAGALVVVSAPSTAVAGVAFDVVVEVRDAQGNPVADRTSSIALSATDPRFGARAVPTATARATASLALETAGTQTLTLTDTATGLSVLVEVVVAAAPATILELAIADGMVGVQTDLRMRVWDPFGNIATSYAGDVTIGSSDARATFPATATFAPGDAGTKTVTYSAAGAGSATITVTDSARQLSASANPTFAPGTARSLRLEVASNLVAGYPFDIDVVVLDAFGNRASGYRGTLAVTTSDPAATLPPAHTFAPADEAHHLFEDTVATKAGTVTVTVADLAATELRGEATASVRASVATVLEVVLAADALATGATTHALVTARDRFGNVDLAYVGKVGASSTDAAATLPADATFVAGEGRLTLEGFVFRTVGRQTVTVADRANAALFGSDAIEIVLGADCNDESPATYLGATEICDGLDNDCDGKTDDDDTSLDPATRTAWFPDVDEDGFGDEALAASPVLACARPLGSVPNARDCDDSAAGFAINPDATEICDGVDNDCDDLRDDDDATLDPTTGTDWFRDRDEDGFGDRASAGTPTRACARPLGHVANARDCDDGANGAAIHPDATEVCDGVDNDCDNLRDDDDASLDIATQKAWFADFDTDGFGDETDLPDYRCEAPTDTTYADRGEDCNDDNRDVHPDVVDVTGDGLDANCDGKELCYLDGDDDGYRKDATTTKPTSGADATYYDPDCDDPGEALGSEPTTDCDDTLATRHPGRAESCDAIDNDCDTVVDNGFDVDGDLVTTCGADGNPTTTADNDCNDNVAETKPGATDATGDGIDSNCDGKELCFLDADNDGFRKDDTSTKPTTGGDATYYDGDCADTGEALASEPTTDCDDTKATRYPGNTEVCDAIDNDCDTLVDDGFDVDGDLVTTCGADGNPTTTADNDCNDAVPGIKPGATDTTGDGVDSNCDGKELCYLDADNDGYRKDGTSTKPTTGADAAYYDADCDDTGEALASEPTTDCVDTDAATHPGATDVCSGTVAADYDPAQRGDRDCDPIWRVKVDKTMTNNPEYCTSIQAAVTGVASKTYSGTRFTSAWTRFATDWADLVGRPILAEITVADGEYAENLDFTSAYARVISKNGSSVTTLRGNGTNSVVRFLNTSFRKYHHVDDADPLTFRYFPVGLDGFTIQGGINSGGAGGGVRIDNSSVILANMVIRGNTALNGGGVAVVNTGPGVTNIHANANYRHQFCTTGIGQERQNASLAWYTACLAGNLYDPPWNDGLWGPTIVRSRVHDNSATNRGGGVYATATTNFFIFYSELVHNKATAEGGGGYVEGYTGWTQDASGNETFGGNHPWLFHAVFAYNQSGTKGGGVYTTRAVELKWATLSCNHAPTGMGDGVYFSSAGDNNKLTNVIFTNDEYVKGGAALVKVVDPPTGPYAYVNQSIDTGTSSDWIADFSLELTPEQDSETYGAYVGGTNWEAPLGSAVSYTPLTMPNVDSCVWQ